MSEFERVNGTRGSRALRVFFVAFYWLKFRGFCYTFFEIRDGWIMTCELTALFAAAAAVGSESY